MDIFNKVTEDGEDLFSVFDSSNPVSKKRTQTTTTTESSKTEPTSVHEEWITDMDSAPKPIPGMKGAYSNSLKKPKVDGNNNNTESIESRLAKEDAIALIGDVEKSKPTTADQEEDEIITCLHEVCLPPDTSDTKKEWDPEILHPKYPPAQPARTWPFNLDPFQKKSVAILERNESVLVSAHTSAGKTVIAEYAIAKSLKNNQRVVYTSPIKALSNQKYREFYEIFNDVGLMTGDITINPNASCLVMTTEILRSMLYRGSEIIREVAWVVFDEIHYMRDKERGVVWEETIILLPDLVRYVFLSATIPNAKEFASWIAKIHGQPCHVVYTEMRPTPLQHYIFPSGGDGLHLVVDEKGVFREDNFQKALSALVVAPQTNNNKKKQKKGGSDVYKIVKMIMERNYQPVIVFSFSKKECEALALQMSKLDLTTADEKKLIDKVYANAIDSLNDDDKKLPQVSHILPLLKRGVGIHHSGLLPILKEVIEILFQEGMIKALFATETFSIGLNMPAKTVVFTNVRKFDGENFRWVTSGEYIQMSGRAGRRGLDDRGIVIMMVDEKMEPSVIKGMVKGQADSLYSSFYIGYNMLLNLLRVEGFDPEYLLKRSFHQYQNQKQIPEQEKKLREIESERDRIKIPSEEIVIEYHNLKDQLGKLKQIIRETITQPIHIVPYLQPGRLVKLEKDWGWGVIVNFTKLNDKTGASLTDNMSAKYIVDVLLFCVMESGKPRPAKIGENPTVQVVPITLPVIEGLSLIRVYMPEDLRPLEKRQSVGKSLKEVAKRFPDGVPLLDPLEDMKIEDSDFKKVVRRVEMIEDKLNTTSGFKSPDMEERYENYKKKLEFEEEIKVIRKYLKSSEEVIMKHELKSMKRVLRRLGYLTAEDVIETKGRVACEISAGDEILITELMFAGFFNDLTVEQIVAVLSTLIFEEKSETAQKLKEELAAPLRNVQEVARKVAKVSMECKLKMDSDEYVKKVNPALMEVALAWAKGSKFGDICGMTDVFEGSIIRALRRLEELLRELGSAAKSIGNTELETKFADGISKIKRDIVFAASLYL